MNAFTMISFIIVVALIWVYAWRKSRNVDIGGTEGYFMGGKSLTALPIAGTIIMTNLSTEQIVGQNGQAYEAGMQVMAWEVTSAIAIVAFAVIFLPKYLSHGINSVTDFLEIRYDATTKRIISVLFILQYCLSFLPVVLYSGALVFNKLFKVDEVFNISPLVAVAIVAGIVGIVGVLYLLMGGLSLSANSDTIYGVGLLTLGLAIPILGILYLGDGSFITGLETIGGQTPELLSSIGSIDSQFVPWPTLFTGMLFNNLYFWCTNQMIIQKAFSAKDLGEAQKGSLIVGIFKIVACLFLVAPGVIARNAFGDQFLGLTDQAYPALVELVLPNWLLGIFAAVIFGAILSSFAGALNSVSTLFALDFYKPMINKEASDKQVVRVGKIVTVVVGLISIVVAPLISFAPAGLYQFTQEIYGFYSMPLLAIVLFAFWSKTATARGAKFTIIIHVILYTLSKFMLVDVHYLYVLSGLFVLDCIVLWVASKAKPEGLFDMEAFAVHEGTYVQEWKYTKPLGIAIVVAVIATYVFFSPLGVGG